MKSDLEILQFELDCINKKINKKQQELNTLISCKGELERRINKVKYIKNKYNVESV